MEKLSAEEEPKNSEGQDDYYKEDAGNTVGSAGSGRNEEEVIGQESKELQGQGYEAGDLITPNAQQGEDHKLTVEGEGVGEGLVAEGRELEGRHDVETRKEENEKLSRGRQDEEKHPKEEDAEGAPVEIRSLGSDVEAGVELVHAADNSVAQETLSEYENGSEVREKLSSVPEKDSSRVETASTAARTTGVTSEELEGLDNATVTRDVGELSEGMQVKTSSSNKSNENDTDLTEGHSGENAIEENEAAIAVQEKLLPESEHASSRGTEEGWRLAATEPSDNSATQTTHHDNNQAEESIGIPSQAQAEDLNKTEPVDADKQGDRDKENEHDNEGRGADIEMSSGSTGAGAASGGAAPQTPSLGAAGPSLLPRSTRTERSSSPSMESTPRGNRAAAPSLSSNVTDDDSHSNGEEAAAAGGNDETREKLHTIRIKLLRLASRLGQSTHSAVVAQVLYRLGLAEQLRGSPRSGLNANYSLDRAMAIAAEAEAAGPGELDFRCTIMLLGKTGVGKSATVNSIFDEPMTGTDAFGPATTRVRVITGNVNGAKVRVIDTPGLLPSVADQGHNRKAMASVKWFIRTQAPDIVLYFDRLDMQSRDYGDLPLLRTITDTFGAAVWFNAIVVLTHASSAPPDGPNGLALDYEMLVSYRSHAVQQAIRQAAGDMRLMNPVSLVENHAECRVNRSGGRVLPNGQVWKPQLLMLCFASKILAEANSVLKLQDNAPGRTRARVPPLPFLLSSLLQSRAQLKMPDEQGGDEGESEDGLEEDDDSDDEEDYDQLPPFRRLSKEELAELDKDNRGKYFEELAERERLFQKKEWKEEKKRRREWKGKMAGEPIDQSQFADEGLEDDMARSTAVAVPMPDMVLPPSFDSDNPTHRYRYLEAANQWLVRPVSETHGWDHDTGYDGMNVEKGFAFGERISASVSGQIIQDKKDTNLNLECAASLKLGLGMSTLAGLDVQSVGKDVAYTLRSETGFSNFKRNKTFGGLALTLLGDTISTGLKIEDKLTIGKRVKLVLSGGAITGRGDTAYGGSLEATLRDKDYPLSRTLSSLGLSIMDWHGDMAIGGNLQSQFMLGTTMMVGTSNLNNRGAGQISIKASSSEQVTMALIGLVPIIRSLANHLLGIQSQE